MKIVIKVILAGLFVFCSYEQGFARRRNLQENQALQRLFDNYNNDDDFLGKVQCLKRQSDAEWRDKKTKQTLLHRVANFEQGNLNATTKLVELGADINAQDSNGKTPLHYAAAIGNKDVVDYLLGRGAKSNVSDNLGNLPIFDAVIAKKFEVSYFILEFLTKKNPSAKPFYIDLPFNELRALFRHTNNEKKTLLYLASENNDIELATLLLDQGSLDNAFLRIHNLIKRNTMNDGKSPLHAAVLACHEEMVNLFIQKKVPFLNHQDNNGDTPLHIALIPLEQVGQRKDDAENIAKSIITALASQKSFYYGYDKIWLRNKAGETPLFLAAKYGLKEMVQLLCEQGALSVNNTTSCGLSPENIAQHNNFTDISYLIVNKQKQLFENRSSISRLRSFASKKISAFAIKNMPQKIQNFLKNPYSQNTPLHIAAAFGNVGAVNKLLGLGFPEDSENSKNRQGQTPLHLAAMNGQGAVIKAFESHIHTKFFETDNFGRTPLHYVATFGHPEAAQALLEMIWEDVSINRNLKALKNVLLLQDNEGRTPLHLAAMNCPPLPDGKKNVIETVINFYISKANDILVPKDILEAKDNTDKTPLDLATEYEQVCAEKTLVSAGATRKEWNENRSTQLIDLIDSENFVHAKKLLEKITRESQEDQSKIDVNVKRASDGNTALHLAVQKECLDLLTELFKISDLNFTVKNYEGQTPLHFAYLSNEKKDLLASALLIERKSSLQKQMLETRDNSGDMPLFSAAVHGDTKILKLAKEVGCDVTAWKKDKTLLDLAADNVEDFIKDWAEGKMSEDDYNIFIQKKAQDKKEDVPPPPNFNINEIQQN